MKKNILVFPCGSEIGLEIFRSLQYSLHFNVIGANSVPDHGRFVYKNYIPDLPYVQDAGFIERLNSVIEEYNIDLIYPTMDSVIAKLTSMTDKINCKIVSHPASTTAICLSKKKTTQLLSESINMPMIFKRESIYSYPVFLKPDIGYSGKNTLTAYCEKDIDNHLNKYPDCLIMEYLPGEEYTVDCFTDKERKLMFAGSRLRSRISNGISVHALPASPEINKELCLVGNTINEKLHLRGAWFFQVKRSSSGMLKVMEVAARLGGSSALFRAKGVNFAELSVWDALDKDVSILENDYAIEMDRALDNRFVLQLSYKKVFVDFDDTMLISGKLNIVVLAFLFQSKNDAVSIICLSRHKGDLNQALLSLGILGLFDEVIHLKNDESKADFVTNDSIFIDDSFAERKTVASKGIPVFAPDMVSALMNTYI